MAVLPILLLALAAQPDGALIEQSRRAKEMMAAGRFEQAIALYERLCRALPGNPGLLLNLGMAYQAVGNHDMAIPHFEAALDGDPGNAGALVSLGASRLAVGDAAKAIEALEKVKAPRASHDIRGMLGNAYLAGERFEEGAAVFRQLSVAVPNDPKAWAGLGRSYDALAAQAYEELSRSETGSARWLAVAAYTRMDQRQYRSAFYFFQQALAKDAKLRGAQAAIAEVYRKTNHADWAASAERKEAALGAVDCAKEKAECDFQARRFREAAKSPDAYWRIRAFNELSKQAYAQLERLPPTLERHSIRAQMYAGRNLHLEAASEWRAAEKLKPGDGRIRRELATSLYLGHDYKSALPLLEAFLARDKDSPELNFFVGDSHLRLEQPGKSVPYLEAALKAAPDLLPAHASLGMAYSKLDKSAAAVPHLKAALPMDEDGALRYQLARAYQATGAAELARQVLAEYQQLRGKLDSEKKSLEEEVQITPP